MVFLICCGGSPLGASTAPLTLPDLETPRSVREQLPERALALACSDLEFTDWRAPAESGKTGLLITLLMDLAEEHAPLLLDADCDQARFLAAVLLQEAVTAANPDVLAKIRQASIQISREDSAAARDLAAYLLSMTGPPTAAVLRALEQMLWDPDFEIWAAAMITIGKFGPAASELESAVEVTSTAHDSTDCSQSVLRALNTSEAFKGTACQQALRRVRMERRRASKMRTLPRGLTGSRPTTSAPD